MKGARRLVIVCCTQFSRWESSVAQQVSKSSSFWISSKPQLYLLPLHKRLCLQNVGR